ncbi:helix-turn-helix domain-containing protein [Azospira restricta]|uniref:Helix-turn-helix domain-containing protein n=1 Tax=Azospira restricta TaxID=404405 RepID=A0A974SN14_9RHOO|nr:helix-turn-helix domain-containing protein [Azospira restricta]QRJ63007.1 helix-turn-helix domain-containing protein [Azospira restricta]
MSEISLEGQVEEVAVAAKPSVGERLRAAREAKGLSAADVAAALKLSPRQIEALETGNWSGLPGHAFIRGFVRNYARFAQLPIDELLADLDAPAPTPPRLDLPQNATAVMPPVGQAQKRDYAAVLAGFVLVAVAVVAYFVVPPDLWQSAPKEEAPAATGPAPLFPPGGPAGDAGSAPVAAAAPTGAAAAQEAVAAPPALATAAAESAAKEVPAAAAVSANALKLRFAQPSWVEVRDRSGQIIFSQLNPAGSEREVDGQPPYSLVVGNAAHVTVSYQGRNVELQPRSKDDVARITVE